MAGEWTWQLATVVGALGGAVLTLIALGGSRRKSGADLEQSRKAILQELREIEALLGPSPSDRRAQPAPGRPSPEPIRMVQMVRETSKKEAA